MLKVNDIVTVRTDLQDEVKYGDIMFHRGIRKFLGKQVTIGNIPYENRQDVCNVLEDNECHLWHKSMFI